MSKVVWNIKDCFGKEIKIIPELFLYEVSDYMGRKTNIPGIQLYTEIKGQKTPYATITKSFGEFIGLKNTVYIDTGNYPFITQLLELGIAEDTGLTKHSAFCNYPLWIFEEGLLKSLGESEYDIYSKKYDKFMFAFADA